MVTQHEKLKFDMAEVNRKHIFYSSRELPDGTQPEAPHWNPGCRCGEGMYFFEHDKHLAEEQMKLLDTLEL